MIWTEADAPGDVARVKVGSHPEHWVLVPVFIENGRTRSARQDQSLGKRTGG